MLRNAQVAMKALPNRRTDQRDDAREHLTTATTMYREMDMPFWLEQAEAEVRILG